MVNRANSRLSDRIDGLYDGNADMLRGDEMMDEFSCNCSGQTRVIDSEHIEHKCERTSQSYGLRGKFIPYHRVKIHNTDKYNWFATWV